MATNINALFHAITRDKKNDKSKWAKGVRRYAAEMVANLDAWGGDIRDIFHAIDCKDTNALHFYLLDGAKDWEQYARDGSGIALAYNEGIADRLATPSEIKRRTNKAGQLSYMANSREDWIDVEARALWQAERLVFNYLERL